MTRILQVVVPSPLRTHFDYLPINSKQLDSLKPGVRLEIPFGRQKKIIGLLIGIAENSSYPENKLKRILRVIDEQPLVSEQTLNLMLWASRYYQHPVGDVVFSALPKLFKQGREQKQDEKIGADEIPIPALNNAVPESTDEQRDAIDALISTANGFHCTVLNGITGSGKTQVYMHLMQHVLNAGQQVLLLLPEIGLTPQLVERFQHAFNCEIGVYHSGLTDLQRFKTWHNAREHKLKIIIGTRSAIWLPFDKLGLIIIDEEHDQSYKQQEGFRYSARDVAVYRSQQLNIPIVLGSATPSMESSLNVQRKRYGEVRLQQRIGQSVLPTTEVIDLKSVNKQGALSQPLIDNIRQTLARKQQTLLFINQRGYAPAMLCDACGEVAICERCDKPMTYHRQRGVIWCHHCDRQLPLTTPCQTCQSQQWVEIGHGTERVEDEISQIFPSASVLRIDRDTTRKKGTLDHYLQQITNGDIDILIGTQMLAKGHHFQHLTLVGILDIDNGLYCTDFRASERLAQLITQVSGRAGRADSPGKVLLQTYQPEHPLLRTLLKDGYDAFTRELLVDRENAGLPPFSYHVLLRAEATNKQYVEDFLGKAAQLAKSQLHYDVYGPIASPMAKRAGKHRMQLLIEAKQRGKLASRLGQWVNCLDTIPGAGKIRWSVDVDPQDMF